MQACKLILINASLIPKKKKYLKLIIKLGGIFIDRKKVKTIKI